MPNPPTMKKAQEINRIVLPAPLSPSPDGPAGVNGCSQTDNFWSHQDPAHIEEGEAARSDTFWFIVAGFSASFFAFAR